MNYLKNLYTSPAILAIKRWKTLLLTIGIEVLTVIIIALISISSRNLFERFAAPLANHAIDHQIAFLQNVEQYGLEASHFFFAIVILLPVIILLLFTVFTISRYYIWKVIHKKKIAFKRILTLDAFVLIPLFVIFLINALIIKPEIQLITLPITLLPLLYFLLFVHIEATEPTIKNVFRRAFSQIRENITRAIM
jgi:hypothetical protein